MNNWHEELNSPQCHAKLQVGEKPLGCQWRCQKPPGHSGMHITYTGREWESDERITYTNERTRR